MMNGRKYHALLTNVDSSKRGVSNASPQDRRRMWIFIRAEWLMTEPVLRCKRPQPCVQLLRRGCLPSWAWARWVWLLNLWIQRFPVDLVHNPSLLPVRTLVRLNLAGSAEPILLQNVVIHNDISLCWTSKGREEMYSNFEFKSYLTVF